MLAQHLFTRVETCRGLALLHVFAHRLGQTGPVAPDDPLDNAELDLTRLGELMQRRRKRFGLSQDVIRALGGPSGAEQSKFETGARAKDPRPIRGDTWRKIDRGMGWEQGSAQRVARGGKPEELGGWPWSPLWQLRNDIVYGQASLPADVERRIIVLAVDFEKKYLTPPPGFEKDLTERDIEDLLKRRKSSIRGQIQALKEELEELGEDPDELT